MADGGMKRFGYAGRWGALIVLAAVVAVGLWALPIGLSSAPTQRIAAAAPRTAALHALTSTAARLPGAGTQIVPVDAPMMSATAAYLLDPKTGEVFYANNALDEVPMASTTKIMTAIVAMTFGKINQPISVGQDARDEQNGENSVADLQLHDALTLHDLLYALLLPSGDDAAVAVADGVAGSQANFVAMMNMEAALLGLDHTHYTNVHGLDAPNHYTTVGDLARLARVAMNFPLFAQIVKTPIYSVTTPLHGTYNWKTTNELLTPLHYYQGIIGVKTGHTGGAGYCLVFAATRSGSSLVGVILGEQDSEQRFVDAYALLDWGFSREKTVTSIFNAIAGKHTSTP